MIDQKEIDNAKEALKATIKFCRAMLEELTNKENRLRAPAFVTAWCIDNYMQTKLQGEVAQMLKNASEDSSKIILN